MPAIVLCYCTFQGTLTWKPFSLFLVFFMYYFCEKYYKPITVQYYITKGVNWLPRLTLLDLNKQKLDLQIHSTDGTHS